ncbi:MAG TPA: Bax inhibitor-1/YccA family protein [Elusimicrobiota bacterium]|nr:Bax inhibitor-1/YccA family protein [Elusimicrobiota bacterium]
MMDAGGYPLSADQAEERSFIVKVYRWMTGGLALTGGVALYMAAHPASIRALAAQPILFYGLMAVELLAVFGLAAFVRRMSSATASFVFLGYAALNGVTLSSIFLVYTQSSIASAFFVTAGTFAAMSLYGWMTKTDLTSLGNILFMALIGLVIASFANLFFRNSTVYWITTYAGVLIFTGLTAYDTQKIKGMLNPSDEGTDMETKEAISGALALYLDFINLFLDILQIMGRRED